MTSPHTGDTLGSAGPTSPSKHLKSRSRFQPKKQQDGGNGWSKLSTNHSMKWRDGGASASLMITRMSMRNVISITKSMRKSKNMSVSSSKSNKKESKKMRESKIMSMIYLTVGKGAGSGGREVHGVREE